MLSAIRRHLSYANVVATLALVLSSTGAAVAAQRYLITSTGQISPAVLRALRGHKGRNGKAGATGPVGTRGRRGAYGAAGLPGPLGIEGTHGLQGPEGPRGPRGAAGRHGERLEVASFHPRSIKAPAVFLGQSQAFLFAMELPEPIEARVFCTNLIEGLFIVTIRVYAPQGSRAETALVAANEVGGRPEAAAAPVQDVELAPSYEEKEASAGGYIVTLADNKPEAEHRTNVGHLTGSIFAPHAVIYIDAFVEVHPVVEVVEVNGKQEEIENRLCTTRGAAYGMSETQ
jgi:Collagen triple helix repeat (20 copies)